MKLQWPSRTVFYFDKRELDGNVVHTAYRADVDGNLSVWEVPNFTDDEVVKHAARAAVCKPTVETSLAKIWQQLRESPPNIFESEVR